MLETVEGREARRNGTQGLPRYCWAVLVIAALGWLFDTMDQNLFNLVRVSSLRVIFWGGNMRGQELADQC